VIVVDTSTWIDHIRGLATPLEDLLGQSKIALHPFVFGELTLNGLPKSGPFCYDAFSTFAEAPVASAAEVSAFIRWSELAGKGIGYVDVHLLMSARMIPNGRLLTSDKNLLAQALRFELDYRS
jgi:predicted nucleic acid-binding protein